MAKGVKIDGKKFRQRRQKLAMSVESLEIETGISKRTITRAESGEAVTTVTLSIFAEALGVEPADLLPDPPLPPTEMEPLKGDLVQISFVINATIERYAIHQVRKLLDEISKQLRIREFEPDIVPISIAPGSVILVLEMPVDQLKATADAFAAGAFDDLGVVRISSDIIEFDRESAELSMRVVEVVSEIHFMNPRKAKNVTHDVQ